MRNSRERRFDWIRSSSALGLALTLAIASAQPAAWAEASKQANAISTLTQPAISCRQAWSKLIATNQHRFQFGPQKKDDYESYSARIQRKGCTKEWAVLVYMAAEEDLLPYAYWDLYEMEAGFKADAQRAGSTVNRDLVVQFESLTEQTQARLQIFQTPTTYQYLSKRDFEGATLSRVQSPVISSGKFAGASSESERFQEFLNWAVEEFPAEHYLIVVWGHGKGWETQRMSGRRMDVPSIRKALESVTRRLGRPLDVYSSDACLMQTAEVASEIGAAANYVVGSAQIQNYLGLPYRRIMFELNSGRLGGLSSTEASNEARSVSRMIPQIYREAADPKRGTQGRLDPEMISTLTSSAVDARVLRTELWPALNRLGETLAKNVVAQIENGIELEKTLSELPRYSGGSVDLGALLDALSQYESRSPDSALKGALVDARAALETALVGYSIGESYVKSQGAAAKQMRALSIWIPKNSDEFNERVADYGASEMWSKAPGWRRWLKALFI